MAELENVESSKSPELEIPQNNTFAARVVPWLLTAVVVVVLAAGGFLIGRLFGTRGQAQTASGAESGQAAEPAPGRESTKGRGAGETWYYDLDPTVVNLNEPGVTRYVRIGLTLEISSEMKQEEGKTLLDQKKPLMKHWLTLFLSNQTLEETRGEKNLLRMQTRISEAFNESIFSDTQLRIQHVLFKEFAIQ